MNYVDKIEIPFEQMGGSLPNPIKDKYKMKIQNLLKIMSKLASISAYDNYGRIRDQHGEYKERTDIADLLTHAMSPGKVIVGEDLFIDLLKEANVPKDLIMNESIRQRLNGVSLTVADRSLEPQLTYNNLEPVVQAQPLKRKREDDDEEQEISYKRKRHQGFGAKWIIPKF